MKQSTALIVGMARSGISSAKLLYKKGYRVIINDIKPDIPGLKDALRDIEYVNGLGRAPEELFDGVDMMVISPVIPIFSPFAKLAAERGIEVIGEIELGYRMCAKGAKFVCISGTNGKTTTTALTGEIFRASGRKTFVLGNIGLPITEHALDTKDGDVIVAETAALQLESIKQFHVDAAGMLNISEDHLNRFEESMENYVAAKMRIFENQTEEDFAVLNWDDETVRNMSAHTKAKIIYYSQNEALKEGIYVSNDRICERRGGVETEILNIAELKIPGRHNIENALCAMGLALCMGVSKEAVRSGLMSFKGVEHRLEFVRELDGVRYINDSKATNPDSAIKAVEAMDRRTVLLLGAGNYQKFSDFKPLFDSFKGRIKHVLCSGINVPAIMKAAEETGFCAVTECGTDMAGTVEIARTLAKEGETVLLSPAAASWGVFEDFEERGRIFKEIVRNLK